MNVVSICTNIIIIESIGIVHKRLKFSGARYLCVWLIKSRTQRASIIPLKFYILRFIREMLKYLMTSLAKITYFSQIWFTTVKKSRVFYTLLIRFLSWNREFVFCRRRISPDTPYTHVTCKHLRHEILYERLQQTNTPLHSCRPSTDCCLTGHLLKQLPSFICHSVAAAQSPKEISLQ